jgi:hypothetical protein
MFNPGCIGCCDGDCIRDNHVELKFESGALIVGDIDVTAHMGACFVSVLTNRYVEKVPESCTTVCKCWLDNMPAEHLARNNHIFTLLNMVVEAKKNYCTCPEEYIKYCRCAGETDYCTCVAASGWLRAWYHIVYARVVPHKQACLGCKNVYTVLHGNEFVVHEQVALHTVYFQHPLTVVVPVCTGILEKQHLALCEFMTNSVSQWPYHKIAFKEVCRQLLQEYINDDIRSRPNHIEEAWIDGWNTLAEQ